MINGKTVILTSVSEEGYAWQLQLDVCEHTKRFSGYFTTYDELAKQRKHARSHDRDFFKARLGTKYMVDKVLHHSWIETSPEYTKVVLISKDEHPNGGMYIARERDAWIEKEVWL